MGYTLIIGNAVLDFDKEYNSINITAERMELPNAPAFKEPTDFSNERWPSYTSWHDFARFVSLYDLFFDKNFEGDNGEKCLIYEHSGVTVLSQYHKEVIDKAYKNFYEKYPNCKAGYSPKIDENNGFYEDKDWPKENAYAVRLEWLKFWVDYTLENCERPIFYNS